MMNLVLDLNSGENCKYIEIIIMNTGCMLTSLTIKANDFTSITIASLLTTLNKHYNYTGTSLIANAGCCL